ncbi:hypothetical protein THAOC_19975, partial [Thalassiosira oceanica]
APVLSRPTRRPPPPLGVSQVRLPAGLAPPPAPPRPAAEDGAPVDPSRTGRVGGPNSSRPSAGGAGARPPQRERMAGTPPKSTARPSSPFKSGGKALRSSLLVPPSAYKVGGPLAMAAPREARQTNVVLLCFCSGNNDRGGLSGGIPLAVGSTSVPWNPSESSTVLPVPSSSVAVDSGRLGIRTGPEGDLALPGPPTPARARLELTRQEGIRSHLDKESLTLTAPDLAAACPCLFFLEGNQGMPSGLSPAPSGGAARLVADVVCLGARRTRRPSAPVRLGADVPSAAPAGRGRHHAAPPRPLPAVASPSDAADRLPVLFERPLDSLSRRSLCSVPAAEARALDGCGSATSPSLSSPPRSRRAPRPRTARVPVSDLGDELDRPSPRLGPPESPSDLGDANLLGPQLRRGDGAGSREAARRATEGSEGAPGHLPAGDRPPPGAVPWPARLLRWKFPRSTRRPASLRFPRILCGRGEPVDPKCGLRLGRVLPVGRRRRASSRDGAGTFPSTEERALRSLRGGRVKKG